MEASNNSTFSRLIYLQRSMQVEDRLHHLTVQQNKMAAVLGRLRQVESGLPSPDTSASADPQSTITALGQAATMLNEVLRRVDQAHAELPPIFEPGVEPTLPQLENVQLPDVDADTRVCVCVFCMLQLSCSVGWQQSFPVNVD